MGMNDFMLNCERDNNELRKNIEYYKNKTQRLQKENERLLELCMYSLIRDTKIYNREIDNETKSKFIKIIKDNLNYDTYTIRQKLIDVYEDKLF